MNSTLLTEDKYQHLSCLFKKLVYSALLGGFATLVFDRLLGNKNIFGFTITTGMFIATSAAFVVIFVYSIRHQRQIWQALYTQNKSDCFGQIIGIAVFGSLMAMMFFSAPVYALSHFLHIGSKNLQQDLAQAFHVFNLLSLVIMMTVSGLLTFFTLRLSR